MFFGSVYPPLINGRYTDLFDAVWDRMADMQAKKTLKCPYKLIEPAFVTREVALDRYLCLYRTRTRQPNTLYFYLYSVLLQ